MKSKEALYGASNKLKQWIARMRSLRPCYNLSKSCESQMFKCSLDKNKPQNMNNK